MRWFPYFILAYVTIGLQIGLSGFVRISGVGPNLVLIGAIFVAMNAPREAALIGCFLLGALQDITTQEPMGLYAFCYGLTALLILPAQELVDREHSLTFFMLTLAGGVIVAILLALHGWIHPPAVTRGAPVRVGIMGGFITAIYSAILAIPALRFLQKSRRVFAFERRRRMR